MTNKKAKLVFFIFVTLMLCAASAVRAESQFRIAILSKNADMVLQGKPSATVGIDAFLQEGLDFLKKHRVVFNQNQNVNWKTFLQANGIKARPGSDRYALRSDRYYLFSHITITAIKPHQPSLFSHLKKYQTEGVLLGLGLLMIFTFLYLRGHKSTKRKINLKSKKKPKSKNISRTVKTTLKTKKTLKKKKSRKIKKRTFQKKTIRKAVKKIKKLNKKQTKKNIKSKISRPVLSQPLTQSVSSKKYKSILIKPTAKRIKNIKLARKLALKSSDKKDLTLNDFIQEDLANNPSPLLNPTKTELRSQPGTETPIN